MNQQVFEEYFISNRQVFSDIDRERSKKMAEEFDTKWNMCHYNTWQVKLVYPTLDRFIGFVLLDGVVAVHSWLVDNDKIIDPTLILDEKYLGEEYVGIENNG